MPDPRTPGQPAPARIPIAIREANGADIPAFMPVVAQADPHDSDPFGEAREILASRPAPPLSHGRELCLLAQTPDGTVAGALLGGIPRWLLEHPGIDGESLSIRLIARLGIIHAVAVLPGYRGNGVAHALIRHAETLFTRAGYGLLTLNHDSELDSFYRHLGYIVADQLLIHLPGRRLIGMTTEDTRMSAKALRSPVRFADVPGAPGRIITGLLPGASLPPHARFDRARLRLRY